ncbi:MAG: MBOAT family O-acyltransferase, partial [bacterium]
ILGFYKYYSFSISLISKLGIDIPIRIIKNSQSIIIPLGISFICFTMLAFLIDMYRRKINKLPSISDFFLFNLFFPKLASGPITRFESFQNELLNHKSDAVKNITFGLNRFAIGLGKKVLIADVLAVSVSKVFNSDYVNLSIPILWIAALGFMMQIFFDFSGYTDMAIGLAKIFGINLPENFNQPYLATSIQDFWRRWHITLSSWFRDYLYIPLGGSRVKPN